MLAFRESHIRFMGITELYRAEIGAFFGTLLLLLAVRMVKGEISLRGLFGDELKVKPERLLLFVATMAMGIVYIVQMALDGTSSLPTLRSGWLVMFGVSCLIYVVAKAFRTFGKKGQGEMQ
jgi:hypothetical protein